MPKLKGFFDYFPGLEDVPVERIGAWLGSSANLPILENELANRFLYSQTVPATPQEVGLYLAVLREALKLQPDSFYSRQTKKIFIPEGVLQYVPNLGQVVEAYADAFLLAGVITVCLKSEQAGVKNLGTLLKPVVPSGGGEVYLKIGGRKYSPHLGEAARIPTSGARVDVEFVSNVAKLESKEKVIIEAAGGELGIVIDLRRVRS